MFSDNQITEKSVNCVSIAAFYLYSWVITMLEFAEGLHNLEPLRVHYLELCESQAKVVEFENSFEKISARQTIIEQEINDFNTEISNFEEILNIFTNLTDTD